MNTKINHEYASNSYNGGIMGNDSPGALLDMLAEVASQTLHSEKKRSKLLLPAQCKSKTDYVKRKTHELTFNVPQLLSMPASQLVKQFSIFTSDELKRQYSYTCALVIGCVQKYTSFASEGRARMSIKAHLAEHLEYLKTNKEAYKTFTAKSVSYKNYKISPQSKKSRLQQSRKPQETLNKENKNVITEKSTNYLRNILLNDSTFNELDKKKNVETVENSKKIHNSEQKDIERMDFKVLGDHSYFERLKDEIPSKKETSPFNNSLENVTDENIVLMVVGTDSVHMKEYPRINKKLSEKMNQKSDTVYLPEISWSTENGNKNTEIITSKPKGKAKFIGTSKEEREMALAFMDRIKKKGNPTGSNLECRICNPPRSFTAPTTLVSHYRSHAGIKPYECRICRAVFTRRHSLKYHMLIHQNQTRFTCADCGKKFRHPSHFREHRRRHTGEAPFGCDDCGQRFKTRNTYKRHLKTRHGKVLTTTGELLYLSEEDFQKVRTNRKKKNNTNKDHMIDEGIIATKTIMHCQNDNDQLQNTATEEYIINNDTTDSDKNWKSSDTIQIIKNCFETYEVCSEPHLNKTESIETELSIKNRVFNKDENSLSDEYADKVEDKLPQLQSGSYIKLEIVKDGNNQIICHDNVGQPEIIYHNINEAPSYIKVEYSNLVNDLENENSIEFQENFKFSENQIKNPIQIINETENYFDEESNNSVSEQTKLMQVDTHIKTKNKDSNKHIILSQEHIKYEKENSDITTLNCKPFQELETHEIVSEDLIDLNTLQGINQITNKTISITDTLANQNEDYLLQEDKKLGNYQTVITNLIKNRVIASPNYVFEKDQKLLNQVEQRLYIHNEPLTSIIVQNKCINIFPQTQSKTQLNKSKKFTLLNKHMQAINVKQNENQNTILLLTDNMLQNNILKIDQNNTADTEIKEQIFEKSK
ncbi:uncharacterized protein LOC100642813 [Bombus terrestris]|uniref:Uncharacterized protein LOC100642813 n=1 Tax=Bombus terrestris TaxID=30195 RepID=A0A9B2JNZ1_BOMTE|nr:uncharacterized protein LOC100642813 [Bombus terrestris]